MLSSPSTDLDVQVKKIFGIISYVILNKIVKKEMTGLKKGVQYVVHEIMIGAELIGHEIKENTELAEHETGIHDVKNGATSVANKMKNAI
jgi:hypothetical protein